MRVVLLFVGLGACSSEPASGDVDAGDALVDKSQPLDVEADVPSDAAIVCNEASQGTRWSGWSRVTEADPCCTVEVPDQLDGSVDPLTWIPCTNDASGCNEMPITWGVQPNWTRFDIAAVTPTDSPKTIVVGRRLDVNLEEFDSYSFNAGVPQAAWRDYVTVDTVWTAEPFPADQHAWVFVTGSRDVNVLGTSMVAFAGNISAGMHPAFHQVPMASLNGGAMQDFAASDTTLAFDVEPTGKIGRVSASALNNFVFSDGGSGLINPLVHGDDVLAKSNYGNGGWAEEYVIAADGTATVLRAKPNTQVDNFACDGASLYWTEGHGGSVGADNQPTQEVWSAPYTADPTTLGATAKKLADITGSGGTVIYAVAFNGYYAVSRGYNGATVVRGSDGAQQQMLPGPGRQYGGLTYVSANELWAIMDDGAGTISGTALQRQQLAAWP